MAQPERPGGARAPLHRPPAGRSGLPRAFRHLHRLGPRSVACCFAELLDRLGADPAMLDLVLRWQRLDPEVIAALGGDDFPPVRLRVVPR